MEFNVPNMMNFLVFCGVYFVCFGVFVLYVLGCLFYCGTYNIQFVMDVTTVMLLMSSSWFLGFKDSQLSILSMECYYMFLLRFR